MEPRLVSAHLRAIQAQLNPHFFFNTLQGISVLALTGERDSVVEMLSRLSNLIRVSFDERRPQQIRLAAEMEFLESYLALHQLTLGDRLTVKYFIDADTLDADVPTMLLQPLVENAIVHGIAVKPGDGTIRIQSRRQGNTLMLQVADSGPGFRTSPRRNGIGLSATESRLQLMYGDAHKIEYGCSREGGATVTVVIPFAASQAISAARPAHRMSA
jgi:two-component system, LytTR family, sensor kinase